MKHPKPFPTGAEIAERSGHRVHVGTKNEFNFCTGVITLTADIYAGRDAAAVLISAHELGHTRQPAWVHMLRFLPFVQWWEEARAWEFAVQFLIDLARAR